jgi:hypothetical protein
MACVKLLVVGWLQAHGKRIAGLKVAKALSNIEVFVFGASIATAVLIDKEIPTLLALASTLAIIRGNAIDEAGKHKVAIGIGAETVTHGRGNRAGTLDNTRGLRGNTAHNTRS